MLDGLRILVVDDDEAQSEMYRLALELLGAQVAGAASVDEALAVFARTPADVVVSDIALPGRNGLALARELRAAGVTVPLLALTALGGGLDRDEALAAGFDRYCAKPCPPGELAAVILELVHSRPGSDAEEA